MERFLGLAGHPGLASFSEERIELLLIAKADQARLVERETAVPSLRTSQLKGFEIQKNNGQGA